MQLSFYSISLWDVVSYCQLITDSGANPLALQAEQLPQAIAHDRGVPHGPRRTIPRTVLRCPIVQAQADHVLYGDIICARHHLPSSDTFVVDSGGSHRPEPDPVVRNILRYHRLAIS